MLEYLVLQVRTLSELGWFLTLGTAAQLFALVVVVVKLFMSPLEGEHTDLPILICPESTSWAVEGLVQHQHVAGMHAT